MGREERERKGEQEEREEEEGAVVNTSCFWKCLTDEVSWMLHPPGDHTVHYAIAVQHTSQN